MTPTKKTTVSFMTPSEKKSNGNGTDTILDFNEITRLRLEEEIRIKKEKEDREVQFVLEAKKRFLSSDEDIEGYNVVPRKRFVMLRVFYVKIPTDLPENSSLILPDNYLDIDKLKVFPFGKVIAVGSIAEAEEGWKKGDIVDLREDLGRVIENEDWLKYLSATKDSAFEGSSYIPAAKVQVIVDWQANWGYCKDRTGYDKTEDDLFTFILPMDHIKSTWKTKEL